MELKELKTKSIKELHKLLAQNREKFRSARFSVKAKQLKNIRSIRDTKKQIARILTIVKQKEKNGEILSKQPDVKSEEIIN